MAADGIPEKYVDVLFQEFAYDPIRLSPAEDPAQLLYNRRTLETIWVTKREASNPFTRQPFNIKNVIPQTELRQEMCQYISENRIRGLEVIPDYTKVLNETEMRYMLKDLVYCYGSFSDKKDKKEEDWKILWQKLNLIRLYCQYREENKNLFLLIKGYKYLFKVLHTNLHNPLSEWYSSCEDAIAVCRELARIVDIIGQGYNALEMIPGNSIKPFVYILFNLADSKYLKIDSMVLNIYCQMFYYSIGYDVENMGTLRPCIVVVALKLLGRENCRNITDEDLDNGTTILQAAWLLKRDSLLYYQDYVDVVVRVVILCISRFRDNVNTVPSTGTCSHEGASITIRALTRFLELIQYIVTAEDFEGNAIYAYEKDRLQMLDIVKYLVQMVELVVTGFELRPYLVGVGLNIITAFCKSGLLVMRRNELRVLADFLGSEIVNKYGTNVKRLLQELANNYRSL